MNQLERKQVAVISQYIHESFSKSDWSTLGQITGSIKVIAAHPRLFRSMDFGDDDYPACVAEVLDEIFTKDPSLIPDVVDHFDIGLWYEQKEPDRYRRIFSPLNARPADF